jgi:hypothetical protein
LDESNGPTAFDSFGANNGTYSGSLTLGVTGLLPLDSDTAASFSGGTVTIPYSSTINPAGPFTLELWDKIGSTSGAQYVLALQDRTTGSRKGYAIQHNNFSGGWDFSFGSTAVGGYSTISSPTAVAVGQTYHVVATYDGTNANLYVNGVLVNSTAAVYQGAGAGNVNLTIGTRNGNSPVGGDVIDEVAVYPGALTPNQVAYHYGYGLYGTSSAPLILTDLSSDVTNYPTTMRKFSVVAGGSPLLSYQWYVNNVLQPSATGPSLTLSNFQPSDNGKTVKVVVSNGINPPATSTVSTIHIITTPVLSHRWTFDVDGSDSIGSVTCIPVGGATIANGSLILPGDAGGTGVSRQNCAVINGIAADGTLSGDSLTVEAWCTVTNLVNWEEIYMFGSDTAHYIGLTPRSGANALPSASINTGTGESNTRVGPQPNPWVANVETHVAVVYDHGADTIYLYVDGALAASASMGGNVISGLNASAAYIGASIFNDPDLYGSIDEFRIYPGALPAYQIAQNFVNGPEVVAAAPNLHISNSGGGTVTLTWYTGTLRSSTSLSGPWTPVGSASSPYTTSALGSQNYYRVSVP